MSAQLTKLANLEKGFRRQAPLPTFAPGDTVKVHYQVREGEKVRIQVFQGVVIRKHGGAGVGATFTVRKISYGVGVERTFPVNSPLIQSLDVSRRGRVRRARLFYLRERTGKAARIAERQRAVRDEVTSNLLSSDEHAAEAAASEAEAAPAEAPAPETAEE